jgi:hypothetical protein
VRALAWPPGSRRAGPRGLIRSLRCAAMSDYFSQCVT